MRKEYNANPMTANIIPLPSGRRQELLGALGTRPAPALYLETVDKFAQENWGLSELEKLVSSVAWHVDPESIDLFAKLLRRYCIEFDDPADRPGSGTSAEDRLPKPSDKEKEAGSLLMKAFDELNARRRTLAFTRALPIASLLDDALEEASPVRVIERHMQQIFRPAPPVSLSQPVTLRESEPLFLMFRAIASALGKAYLNDIRSRVVCYFLSSPHENTKGVTVAVLRKFLKLEFPYRRLLFIRFTAPLYERMDPMPERWSDFKWLFEFAETPWEMTRVIKACFELIDHASDLFRGVDGTVERTISVFFAKVRKEQESLGGRSFWDEDTATYAVHEFFRWHARLNNVRTDFHSHLCWMAQEEHELGEPGFGEWDALVREALDEGYVALAQALTAYKVFEEVLLLDRITDWRAFTSLNRVLREESHYELLATAIQFSAQVWEHRGRDLLSERLAAQAASESPTKEDRVLHVLEGTTRVGSKEVELRLVEHVGKHNWGKLTEESKNWLIEADINWSDFNFRRREDYVRTDWSFPASLYFKAIEHELVLRYAPSCREADDCSKGQEKDVSFGQVVHFLRQATKGDPQRSAILKRSNLTPVPNAVLKHLDRFRDKYRNPSAHPKPFDQALLSALRWELFGERVLREILEWLAPAGNIRIAP